MKKSVLFLVAVLLAVFAISLNWAISNSSNPEREEAKFDTRIDNIGFWMEMAKKGYTPYNPDVKVAPAVYTGSKIKAFSVITEDSPDVPVTDINSTQSENSIFVDPNDEKTLLQSNNSTPNPVSGIYGANDFYSFDEGETWGGEVQGAGGSNSGDPTTAISLNGRWFVNYISNAMGQGVSYSDDQGASWTVKTVAPNPGYLADKNHMWIDNSASSPYEGNLYVAWTDFGGSQDGDVVMNHSTDNGETWSAGQNISSAIGGFNQGVHIQTGPEGEVYAFYSNYSGGGGMKAIGMSRSIDGGETWEPAVKIITGLRGIREFSTLKTVRVNDFPVSAVDISSGSNSGNLYVVWANIGVPGINTGDDLDIYMVRSSDKGETWTDPIRVNQDPINEGNIHYFPWIACDRGTGALNVVFYDDRNVSSTQTEVFCANSGNAGDTWEDFKVSDVAFTPSPIPGLASNYFGDYLGITSKDGYVYPVWTDNREGYAMTYCSPYKYNALNYPKDLTGEITFETGNAELTWSYEEQEAFKYFNIYRDGEFVTTSTDTVYNETLPDYGYYNYQVTAFYEEDLESSASSIDVQWGDAHIAVNPESIYEHLTVDSNSIKYIFVENTGQLPLMYHITAFTAPDRGGERAYCAAEGGGNAEHINGVEIGSIMNLSGVSDYTDFTGISTNLNAVETHEIRVYIGNFYLQDQVGVWIDWDQNEVFDDGLFELSRVPEDTVFTGTIQAPEGTVVGTTRMRVRLRYTGDLLPCGSTNWGEVEDYTVNVIKWFDLNPTVDTVQPGETNMIVVNFSADGIDPGTYNATANFFSNDPDIDTVPVDLTLEVSETMVAASTNLDDICAGTEIELSATPYGAFSSPTYSWSSDPEGFESTEQNPVTDPEITTTYFVEMLSDADTYSGSVLVSVRPLPEVSLGADTSICGNGEITLDAGPNGILYSWSTGDTTQTIYVDSTSFENGYGNKAFTVEVFGENKCINYDTIVVELVNCTGIDEINNISVKIYPNPNDGVFNLELNAIDDDIVNIIIYNEVGSVVFRQDKVDIRGTEKLRINLEQNASGVYQLFVKGKNSTLSKRIIAK